MVPVSDGEESSGVGRFYVGKLVVVEEKANDFVDRESADDLHPHPFLLLSIRFEEQVLRTCKINKREYLKDL